MDGIPPKKKEAKALGKELNLTTDQIYKWFWDKKTKLHEAMILVTEMGKIDHINDKKYINELRKEKKCQSIDGKDGRGNRLSANQINKALLKSQVTIEEKGEFDSLA